MKDATLQRREAVEFKLVGDVRGRDGER